MVGGRGWWLRPILVFSLSLDQAEQKNNEERTMHITDDSTCQKDSAPGPKIETLTLVLTCFLCHEMVGSIVTFKVRYCIQNFTTFPAYVGFCAFLWCGAAPTFGFVRWFVSFCLFICPKKN